METVIEREVEIPSAGALLPGILAVPEEASGLVVFAHGAGSSRLSPRNSYVGRVLRVTGRLGTLLFDLLTPEEDTEYRVRFDIPLLTRRLSGAAEWVRDQARLGDLTLGYFGASTGAAAALESAAERADVAAVVSRGGRPDLAADALARVSAPTLLIVGGQDPLVLDMNREAFEQLAGPKELRVVPGATHLFPEKGAIEQVAAWATEWFESYVAA